VIFQCLAEIDRLGLGWAIHFTKGVFMNSKMLAVAAALVGLGMGPALADVVRMDALPYYGGVPGNGSSGAYVSAFYSDLAANPGPNPGYANQILSEWNNAHNSGVGGSNTNLAYHDSVTFTVTSAGLWSFRTGIDLGYGGTLIVDGQALQTQTNDMWWNGGYGDPSQFLQGSINLGVGTHTLNVYGMEGCCDGGTQGQFMSPVSDGFQSFKTTAGAVPEISTWAMMLAGFVALGFAGFVRTKKNILAA
jgi:hypothetical protein